MNSLYSLLSAFLIFGSYNAHAAHVVSPGVVDIETNKVSYIVGPVNSELAEKFKIESMMTRGIPGPRIVIIDSPGGQVDSGQDILDTLMSEGVPLVCVVVGGASSMAFNILSWCDVRLAISPAVFVVHAVEGAIPGLSSRRQRIISRWQRFFGVVDELFRRRNSIAMGLTLSEYDKDAAAEKAWTVGELLKLRYLNGICTLTQ